MDSFDAFLTLVRNKRFDEAKASADWSTLRDRGLCWACADGDLTIVKWFLSEDADPAHEKNGPLLKACENGHTEIVKLLLTYKKVCDNSTAHKNRCLLAAQREEYEDIETLLLTIPSVGDGPSMRKWGYGMLD